MKEALVRATLLITSIIFLFLPSNSAFGFIKANGIMHLPKRAVTRALQCDGLMNLPQVDRAWRSVWQ